MNHQRIVTVVSLLLLALSALNYRSSFAQPNNPVPQRQVQEKSLTLTERDSSLATALTDLSSLSTVTLRADKKISDFRVSLFIRGQSPEEVKENIVWLLAHGDKPSGFHWEDINSNESSYLLRRESVSVRREAEMERNLNRKAALWLKEFRDACTLSGDARKRAAEKADSNIFTADPNDLWNMTTETLARLTNEELKTLQSGGVVRLPLSRLPSSTAETLASGANRIDGPTTAATPTSPVGSGDIFAELTFEKSEDSRGAFKLMVDTKPIGQSRRVGNLIDPLGMVGRLPRTSALTLDESQLSASIDITDALKGKPEPWDLQTRLEAIANEAGVNIYCEYFPPVRDQYSMRAVFTNKGTVHKLLNQLAQRNGYNVVRHNDSYFLWSKVWFFDRPNLIPDSLLSGWRERSEQNLPFRLQDVLGMARLSDGQIEMLSRTSVRPSLYPKGNVRALRLLCLLTPEQVAQTFTPNGLDIISLPVAQKQSMFPLLSESQQQRIVTGRSVTLRVEESVNPDTRLRIMLNSDGNSLMDWYVSLKPTANQSR